MVREVVDDRHSMHLRSDFQPSLDTAETLQRTGNHLDGHRVIGGHRCRRGGVEDVVFAGQVRFEFRPRSAFSRDFPSGDFSLVPHIDDSPGRLLGKAVTFDPAERATHAFVHIAVSIPGDQQPAPGDEVHQSLECGLDLVEVAVDVSVIELDRCQDHRVRKVVQKLWAFVEERGVVFIAFDDELSAGAECERTAKVFRDSADKKTGGTLGLS